jgi:hypothetical protein
VADRLQEMVEVTDVDGFNVTQYLPPGTFTDVIDMVVPELQRRGVYRTAYTPAETLRERLFPGGGPLLPQTHLGSSYRGAFTD